jgi:cytochrome c peroxidase
MFEGKRITLSRVGVVSSSMIFCCLLSWAGDRSHHEDRSHHLDQRLLEALHEAGFTGRVESTLEQRLHRPLNPELADLGRLLWFDVLGGLHDDNTCGGCHSPTNGMGDTQSIAIGIQNNHLVGPHRIGPRNQRRTPMVVNTAFYPSLMWNGRFSAPSGDPFNNSLGFLFPPPEGNVKFPANDPIITHLLIAQAHIPPTGGSRWFHGHCGHDRPALQPLR